MSLRAVNHRLSSTFLTSTFSWKAESAEEMMYRARGRLVGSGLCNRLEVASCKSLRPDFNASRVCNSSQCAGIIFTRNYTSPTTSSSNSKRFASTTKEISTPSTTKKPEPTIPTVKQQQESLTQKDKNLSPEEQQERNWFCNLMIRAIHSRRIPLALQMLQEGVVPEELRGARSGELSFRPGEREWSIAMSECIKKFDTDAAITFFKYMLENGISANTIIVNMLLDGMRRSGQKQKAIRLFNDMKKYKRTAPNSASYAYIIDVCVKAEDSYSAMLYYKEMCANDLHPSAAVTHKLISIAIKEKKFNTALQFYQDMKSRDIKPTTLTFTLLIEGSVRLGEVAKALPLYEEMKQLGMKTEVVIVNSLIDGCVREKKMDAAFYLFEDLKARGYIPTANTFKFLIEGCKANNMPERIASLEEEQKQTLEA